MRKLSESIFNAGIKRNQGEGERKEDAIKWIDFGDFYIADRLYEKGGNIYFTYEETMEMFPEGGEIGLLDEETCRKLNAKLDSDNKSVNIWRKKNPDNSINLPLSGANDIPQSKTQTIIWIYGESEKYPDENVRCCVFMKRGIVSGNVVTSDIVKTAKVVILLMKKKKMNESIFNAGIKRNQGEGKKKEDEIHWVDFDKFYIADRIYKDDKGNINFSYFDAMRMFPEGNEIGLMYDNHLSLMECHSYENGIMNISSIKNGNSVDIPFVGFNGNKPNFEEIYTWIYGDSPAMWGDDKKYVGIFRKGNIIRKGAFDMYKYKLPILLIKSKKTNESIFNAGIERNQGNEIKKEDKLNLKSCDEMSEYIKSNYITPEGYEYKFPQVLVNGKGFYILIIQLKYVELEVLYQDGNITIPEHIIIQDQRYIENHIPELKKKLKEIYDVSANWIDHFYYITKKEYPDLSNEDIIKIMDMTIDIDKNIEIKKK